TYTGKDDIPGFILDRIMFFHLCIPLFEINSFYLFYRVVSIILCMVNISFIGINVANIFGGELRW
ncbi:hypothetical protein AEW30_18165, partial [Salmonella enterica subsp. enterica serovar Kentucky]